MRNFIVCTVQHNIVRVIKSRKSRWASHVARIEEGIKILTDKHTGKRPFGRPKRRGEGNIRIDLKEIGINNQYEELSRFGSG